MTAKLKNVYIDELDDFTDKYNNTYHRAMTMKPIDVKTSTYIDFDVEKMVKILDLKLVIM